MSGVDLNPAMIAVAREGTSDIDWRVGDATALPYPDGSFDAVVCQSALFFFPEPRQAVEDMARVVRSGGVVALQTYAGLDEQPAYGPFVATVARIAGDEARRLMGTYWSQGDLEELSSLLAAAGLEASAAHSTLGQVRFPSLEAFVHTEIQATPLASQIEAGTYSAIVSGAREALADHEQPDGSMVLPIRACFAAGRKT